MARFDRDPAAEGPVVSGFSGGGFVVDEGVYRALLLTPVSAGEWTAPALADLREADFEPLLALSPQPEFLILGTGPAIGCMFRVVPVYPIIRRIQLPGTPPVPPAATSY